MIHIDVIEETTVDSYTPAAVILPYEVTGEYYVEERWASLTLSRYTPFLSAFLI